MATDHPFQQLFETFGKLPSAHAENVNLEARESIKDKLSVGVEKNGRCILLRAPRAGHGKTHLLTRLQYELGGTHEFIPLHAFGGSRIDATTVLDDILRRLVRPLPAAGGLTVLDLATRRLFSSSLQPLVRSGEVPCQDREGALNALRTRPIETFDFHHPSAVTAHWARENFELLGPRLSIELTQTTGLSLREVSFWVNAMFRFAATPIDNPGRVRALMATVFEDPAAETDAHERLVALLGLMTSLMRVVLVADELEGFSSDETAALRFASFIGALRQSVDRLEVIISVNRDVWDSAFLPRLSGGLADRLSEVVVDLEPLDRAGKVAILDSRAPSMGAQILSEFDADSIPTFARGLVQQAAAKFQELGASGNPSIASTAVTPSGVEPAAPQKVADAQEEKANLEVPAQTAVPTASQNAPEQAPSREVPEPDFENSPSFSKANDGGEDFASSADATPPISNPLVATSPAVEPETNKIESQSVSWPEPQVEPSFVSQTAQVGSSQNQSPVSPPKTPEPQTDSESNTPNPPPESSPTIDSSSASGSEPTVSENPSETQKTPEDKTDRVDNLLKQFRERYGKS
ncbi:MAG: hypothetical protein AB8D78_01010 [Akkermansiaceae bacterium]